MNGTDGMGKHGDTPIETTQREAPIPKKSTTDYKLLLETLRRQILEGDPDPRIESSLDSEETWQSLSAEETLEWSRLAQLAGLPELSLKVLEWLNRTHPAFRPGWEEKVELLRLLGRKTELVQTRAKVAAMLGKEAEESLFRELHPPPASGEPSGETLDAPFPLEEDLGDPFLEMRREESAIQTFMNLFRGRGDVFARQWYDPERDVVGYVPVRRPLSPDDVRDHLSGKRTYGIYFLDDSDHTQLGVIDVDLVKSLRGRELSRDEKDKRRREERYLLERLFEKSKTISMPCLVEFTGGKGYHLWYPFEDPVPAFSARSALRSIVSVVQGDLECYQLEVFPKQDTLSGKGLGNLVKLPLGIHRRTGKPSFFLMATDRSKEAQLEFLKTAKKIASSSVEAAARSTEHENRILVHPRHEAWAKEYPELAVLERKCSAIAQILSLCRSSRTLSVREEKILLGTLGHLPNARKLLHHIFSHLPEYNRPLLDYKISRIRGTPLGCKRIHRLLGDGEPAPPCRFEGTDIAYWTPLLHLRDFGWDKIAPKSERVENLEDALENLVLSIRQVQRFLKAERG